MMDEKEIAQIMKHPSKDIIKAILMGLQGYQVNHIRQRLSPHWSDGFNQSLFGLWYRDDDRRSPARQYFKSKGVTTKHYPEQGWAPEDEGFVEIFQCKLCGEQEDSDDILLNHFRNGHCKKFDELVENSISAEEFWKKMKGYLNG